MIKYVAPAVIYFLMVGKISICELAKMFLYRTLFIVLLLILFINMGCSPVYIKEYEFPVTLNGETHNDIRSNIQITDSRIYDISFNVSFKNKTQRDDAEKFIGDAFNICVPEKICGNPIVFYIKIEDEKSNLIFEDSIYSSGHHAFTARYYRRIIKTIAINRGNYLITIKIPDLPLSAKVFETYVTITTDPRRNPL